MGLKVVDASAVVDALASPGEKGERAADALRNHELCAPAHMKVEVASALRRHLRLKSVSEVEAKALVSALRRLAVVEAPIDGLLERVWELRENVTVADAAYVALAERLSAPLVTCDAAMTRAAGTRCDFELID